MSLHRVPTIEAFTIGALDLQRRGAVNASSRVRKLAFNPLPAEWDPPLTIDETWVDRDCGEGGRGGNGFVLEWWWCVKEVCEVGGLDCVWELWSW